MMATSSEEMVKRYESRANRKSDGGALDDEKNGKEGGEEDGWNGGRNKMISDKDKEEEKDEKYKILFERNFKSQLWLDSLDST